MRKLNRTNKVLIIIFIVLLVVASIHSLFRYRSVTTHSPSSKTDKPVTNSSQKLSASIFFPYWTLPDAPVDIKLPLISNKKQPTMGNLIYFGISPTTVGLNENEPGYSNLEAFHELTKNTDVPRLLTLRMTNNNINQIVLSDQKLQNKIMNQVIAVAQEYDFDGILLDLEYSGLPTNTVKNQILVFTEIAATKAHAQGLTLAMAVFGDTFYRARPYDLKELSQYVDHFYIMAYDLHKVLGDPGPNFPLAGARQFGYDLETMVADISKVLDSDNMTVVFGLFGYDWWVDEEKRPIKAAKALTLAQIKEKFVGECVLQDCVVKRDEQAREVEVNYVDEFSGFHVVWFEDEQSMSEKIQFLQNAGINSVAVWGWGYY